MSENDKNRDKHFSFVKKLMIFNDLLKFIKKMCFICE